MTGVFSERHRLAEKRLRSVLRRHIVASSRTIEQKISDAGPFNQRIDPHIVTEARNSLIAKGIIKFQQERNIHWYYLDGTDPDRINERILEMGGLLQQTQNRQFTRLVGQALEIAVFRALKTQSALTFFGNYPDLDAHDDSTVYSKVEPPSSLNGRMLPGGRNLDFLVHHRDGGYAGLELKNTREWFYSGRAEIREMLLKCCALDVVPVFIARRIHFSTFSVFNPCGVIIHETYNQFYPASAKDLAAKVKDKTLLGYHDVRVGNVPDARLIHFIHKNLPMVLAKARDAFDRFKDLLCAYGNEDLTYEDFVEQVKIRSYS